MSKKKHSYKYNDPKYKLWREKVFRRDRYMCQLCGSKGGLNAHHIKRKADYPNLAYTVKNGITLCATCHEIITGYEEHFEELFDAVVIKHVTFDLLYIFWSGIIEKLPNIVETFKAKNKWMNIFYFLGSKVKTSKKEHKSDRKYAQKNMHLENISAKL